jgi:hypothetical protein
MDTPMTKALARDHTEKVDPGSPRSRRWACMFAAKVSIRDKGAIRKTIGSV